MMSHSLSRRALFGRPSPQSPPEPPAKLVAVLGDTCIAPQGVACGICADSCDPRAIKIRPMLGGRAIPLIDAAACTGCGDCLNVCPVGALVLAPAGSGESKQCA